MDPAERDELGRRIAELTDEALVDHLAQGENVFHPDALAMVRDELRRRGRSREWIEEKTRERSRELPRLEPGGNVVPIAAFTDPMAADQARQILEEEGIMSFVKGIEPGIWGYPTHPFVGGTLMLFVQEEDAERADAVIEDFPPVAEARISPSG